MFLSIGILSSWSRGYSDAFLTGQDLLAAVSTSPVSNAASLAATYLFPIVALLSGIPVFSIIVRYNLMENGVGKAWANLWAVFFPWAAALCVYSGSLLNNVTTCVNVFFVVCVILFPVMIRCTQMERCTQFRSSEFFTSSRLLHYFEQEGSNTSTISCFQQFGLVAASYKRRRLL